MVQSNKYELCIRMYNYLSKNIQFIVKINDFRRFILKKVVVKLFVQQRMRINDKQSRVALSNRLKRSGSSTDMNSIKRDRDKTKMWIIHCLKRKSRETNMCQQNITVSYDCFFKYHFSSHSLSKVIAFITYRRFFIKTHLPCEQNTVEIDGRESSKILSL